MPEISDTSGPSALVQEALRHLRMAAMIEGCTLAVLVCIAAPLKHLAGIPTVSAIMGPVHGIAFVAYVWLIFSTRCQLGWTTGETLRLLVPAFIPFGTFFNVTFLRRKGLSLDAPG